MLILSRKVGEEIVIDVPGREPIVVRLLRNTGCNVRLGIEAEKDVPIMRGECLQKAAADGTVPE